jgi:hypothetical protein
MSYLYLDTKYNEFFVNEEVYEQIVALVQANKQCLKDYRNRHAYTADNPCVGKNICLTHLLEKQPNLTRLEATGITSDGRNIYYFVDRQGYVSTSTEDSSDEARRSLSDTLSYYGFIPPKTVESRGKSVAFNEYYAYLHGDLTTASVIVLVYNQTQTSDKVRGLFLLYKGNPPKELTKRSNVYHHAEELVEATKDESGHYHIGGNVHNARYNADVYEVISQLESAIYDVTRKVQNSAKRTDEQTEGEAAG